MNYLIIIIVWFQLYNVISVYIRIICIIILIYVKTAFIDVLGHLGVAEPSIPFTHPVDIEKH